MHGRLGPNPSNMIHDFSRVPAPQIQRSSFARDYTHKTTFNAGYLIPFYIDEMLPGDTFSVKATTLVRMLTPIFPIMDNLWADIQWFFCPNRILWDNWEKMMGAQDNPGDSTDFLTPHISAPVGGFGFQTIYDYMGIPTGYQDFKFNALPLRGFNKIFNDWYKDENFDDDLPIHTGDGPDPSTDYTLQRRRKRKDYFTSALPWAQKGQPVTLPLGVAAPVVYPHISDSTSILANGNIQWQGPSGVITPQAIHYDTSDSTLIRAPFVAVPAGGFPTDPYFQNVQYNYGLKGDASAQLNASYADLTGATAATINDIRTAVTIQQFLERQARGGTRYVELLWSQFKVISPDFRLQRPELLNASSSRINVSPVPQTSSTDVTSPQGNLAAFATGSQSSGFHYSAVEHGFVYGFISVRADLTYQQGLDRMWSRENIYDYYFPVFANLGEQPVYRKEIYCTNDNASNNVIFGYQEPWGDYRFKRSMITGYFRSSANADSLDAWHLSQYFSAAPELNSAFLEENPPMDRVLYSTDGPQFWADIFVKIRSARPMPIYGVPGLSRF